MGDGMRPLAVLVPECIDLCARCGYEAWRPNYPCNRCGGLEARRYVPADALVTDEALTAAAEAHRHARDQIEYFGASDYGGPLPSEAAIRAAIAAALPPKES